MSRLAPTYRSAALLLTALCLFPLLSAGGRQGAPGQPAAAGTPPSQPAPLISTAPAITLQADALTPDPDAGTAFKDAVSQLPFASDWVDWAHADGQPIRITHAPDAPYAASAVRYGDGALVFIKNPSNQKLPTTVEIKLPGGLFAIERRVTSSAPAGAPAPGAPKPKYERLQGVDVGARGIVRKALTLDPGQAVVYRFEDQALAARRALLDLRINLNALGAEDPGPARSVRSLLGEGRRYERGLSPAGDDEDRRLEQLHHLLFAVWRAESALQNYAARSSAAADRSRSAVEAIERLSAGIGGASAVILGLVPQVVTEPAPPASGAATPSDTLVTVSLANTGSGGVSLVKLGLSASGLPAGATVEPADPAVFKSLRPGQTVRAQFTLHALPAGSAPLRCAADVSYFAYGIPAHLYPRSW